MGSASELLWRCSLNTGDRGRERKEGPSLRGKRWELGKVWEGGRGEAEPQVAEHEPWGGGGAPEGTGGWAAPCRGSWRQ